VCSRTLVLGGVSSVSSHILPSASLTVFAFVLEGPPRWIYSHGIEYKFEPLKTITVVPDSEARIPSGSI
jgi:hypothetical protein